MADETKAEQEQTMASSPLSFERLRAYMLAHLEEKGKPGRKRYPSPLSLRERRRITDMMDKDRVLARFLINRMLRMAAIYEELWKATGKATTGPDMEAIAFSMLAQLTEEVLIATAEKPWPVIDMTDGRFQDA